MALRYPIDPTDDHYESQQFGPVPWGVPGYLSQPAMYGQWSNAAQGYESAWWNADGGGAYFPRFHNGLDIAAAEGTPLRAMESGEVIEKGWRTNGGGYVIEVKIRPGTFYTYNHCSMFPAGLLVGDTVHKGQVIAYIGSSGAATGNHCHLSLDIDTRGSDGLQRRLMYSPKLFMPGGVLANDPRIVSSIVPPTLPDTSGGRDLYQWIPSMRHQKPKPVIVRKGAVPLANPDGTAHSPGYSFPVDTQLEVIGSHTTTGQLWAARRYGGNGLFLIRDADVVRWP